MQDRIPLWVIAKFLRPVLHNLVWSLAWPWAELVFNQVVVGRSVFLLTLWT